MASPKAKYIEAAYELLVEEGLENASIRKIAARAGTSSTALYKHFENIEQLVAVASYRFLRDYTTDARTLAGVDLNPLELNLQLWECFAYYSFKEAQIFENLFFSKDRMGRIDDAARTYYEEFPEDTEDLPDFMQDMLQGATLFERDEVLLKQAVSKGMLNIENAKYLSQLDTLVYRGTLALIRDSYDHPGVAREAVHDFMQLVISSYQKCLETGYSILVVDPTYPILNMDKKGGSLNAYQVKPVPFSGSSQSSGVA